MKLKQHVSPGKKAALCTQAVLILMAAGLTVLLNSSRILREE